jgi:PAS domain S-box-containing protein
LLGRWYNLSHTLDNTANGIGLLLLGGATLFAFVELLAARERDHAERERLAEEIEDRIRAEKALRESEERFRTISVSAQDAIIMANQDLEVVYWNPAAQRILGYSREEAVGHSILALLVPKGYDDTVSLDVTSIRRRLSLLSPGRVEEFIVRHKSGGEVLVEVTSTSLTVGGEWHGLAIVRDVTERRQTEQLLQERQAQMINSARLSSLGIMASGLAHEINNPLAIISMAIQELNEALEEDPPRVDQVTRIAAYVERNVLRIERILRGLRNLSRDGGGEPFLEVSLKSIVEDTLELCNARFRMKGVLLDIGEISGDLYVQCRATQVSQILLNLLNNAYDAVEELNERWVRLETTVNDDMLEVSIVDSGKGIPEEVRARILEPFFTTKEVGKGMGLGLSITRSLVEAHSGKLIADTCDGNTRFIVQIPVRHALDEEQGKVAENG